MKLWDRVKDAAGWWFDSLTIAFNLVILAGITLAGVAFTGASGWLRVVGTVVGVMLAGVGLRVQLVNRREAGRS